MWIILLPLSPVSSFPLGMNFLRVSLTAVGLSDQQAVEPASRLLLALMDMYRYIVFKACSVPINVIEHSMRDSCIVLS